MRRYKFNLSNIALSGEAISTYVCVVIGTDHDNVDYDLIVKKAKLVIDSRGVYRDKKGNVIRV